MSAQLTWWSGDQNPAYADQITVGGVAVDLSAKTAQFKMRAVGSATLKVNQPVTTKDASGNFTYAWGVSDLVVTAWTQYLVWVEVTSGGKTQTLYENIITVRAHGTAIPAGYVELEELKSTLELTGQTFADQDLTRAINAASRGIDTATGRRFYLDADATQVRFYTPLSYRRLEITDLAVLTSVAIDRGNTGSYTETWTNGTDFVLEPLNAAADYRPFESIVVRQLSGRWLPCDLDSSVKVTGQFGWAILPEDIKAATGILAAKLLKRVREAPFGIVTAGLDAGAVMRIARTDPDVYMLIRDYSRHAPLL